MADNDAGPFTIRELTGDKRALVLRDRALPYRPFTLKTEQTRDRSRLQGNPVATIQAFGPDEQSANIHGMWKDIFLGDETLELATLDGQVVTTAKELVVIALDIARKGQEVEVTWMHEALRGVVADFQRDWHNLSDVEWTMTFDWEGNSADFQPGPVAAPGAAIRSAPDLSAAMSGKVTSLQDKIVGVAVRAGQAFEFLSSELNAPLEFLADKLAALTEAADSVADQVVGLAGGTFSGPDALLKQVATYQGAANNAGDILTALQGRVERSAFGFMGDDVPSSVAAVQANREAAQAARAARAQASSARAVLGKQADPDLLSTFVARGDLDLRQVSLQFYGTADSWRPLMRFNRFADSRLIAGQVVFIPRPGALPVTQ